MKETLKKIPLLYQTNALVKAWQQERKASSELVSYKQKAAKKGIVLPEREAIIKALREKLGQQGIFPHPKGRNELHIFLAYWLNNWEFVLPKALNVFGKVTEFEWGSQGFDVRASNWLNYRDRMNEMMLDTFYKANGYQPVDIVIGYLAGGNTDPKVLRQMGDAGAVICNFYWDDKLSFRGKLLGGRWGGPAALAQAVDLNLTNATDSLIKYIAEGGLALFWPLAGCPNIHKPHELSFQYDVSFVGQKYGWRPQFISRLQKMGINVTTFGEGWENGPLSSEDMVKLYSKSRINLGFSGVGYSKRVMCLKGRDFEVPMSGGLYLTQYHPELSLVYEIGKEIVVYENEVDCAEKIKWLLSNFEEAEKIRKAGRRRALKSHTWENRFRSLLQGIGFL